MAKVKFTDDQKRVIDTPICNLLVSAAAGSGKTAVLVERIIRQISDDTNPIDIDKLLVVTFTKNAAATMKDRLYKKLEEECALNPSNRRLSEQLGKISYADIMTIDSFCMKVVKNYFFALDIDPNFRVLDGNEGEILLQQTINDILLEEYKKGEPDFLRFVETYGSPKDDDKIIELFSKLIKLSSSHPWQEDFIKSLRNEYLISSTEELNETLSVRDLLKYTKRIAEDSISITERCKDKIGVILEGNNPKFFCNLSDKDKEALNKWLALLNSDLAIYYSLRDVNKIAAAYGIINDSKFDRAITTPKSTENSDIFDEIKKSRDQAKENITKQLKTKSFGFSFENLLEDNKKLLTLVDLIIDIALKILKEYSARKTEKKAYEFSDVAHMALNILVSRDESGRAFQSDYAKELSKNYDEIMIDEYQDSNEIQEVILSAISGEKNGKSNMFMVGDVKQSIYKFRMAKPEIFMKKYADFNNEESSDVAIDLSKNFRSARPVIECVNEIFRGIMTPEICGISYDEKASLNQGADYGEVDLNPLNNAELNLIRLDEEDASVNGTVSLDNNIETNSSNKASKESASSKKSKKQLKTDKNDLMAKAIAAKIKGMVSGPEKLRIKDGDEFRDLRYSDIVILTRSLKGIANELAVTLPNEGIPACVNTTTGYFDTTEVSIVMNYLAILDNPYNDIALASVLHSFMCRLSAEELAIIRIYEKSLSEDKVKKYLYEVVRSYQLSETADELIVAKLNDFFKIYDKLKAKKDYLSLYDITLGIYEETGFYDYVYILPAGELRRANLDMLLEKIRAFAKTDMNTISDFIAYVKNLKKYDKELGEANIGEGLNAVRLMTIHGSKGLEYPVVIVAEMEKQFNMMDSKEQFTLHSELGIGCNVIDENNKSYHKSFQKNCIASLIKRENIAEEIRILYVALTRAKQKLIMFAGLDDSENKLDGWNNNIGITDGVLGYSSILSANSYVDLVAPVLFYYKNSNTDLSSEEKSLKTQIVIKNISDAIKTNDDMALEKSDNISEVINATGGIVLEKSDNISESNDYSTSQESIIDDSIKCAPPKGCNIGNNENITGLKKSIEEYFNYKYPYERDNAAVKYSVSELKHEAMEENEILFDAGGLVSHGSTESDSSNENIEIKSTITHADTAVEKSVSQRKKADNSNSALLPGFMRSGSSETTDKTKPVASLKAVEKRGNEANKGALKGTMTHLFMEHVIMSDAITENELKAYAKEQIEASTLPADILEYVSIGKVSTFLKSSLAKAMRKARDEGKLYIEQPFEYGMPAKEVKPGEFVTDELILIQGVIDAFFIEDGAITIVDYKTDRLKSDNGEEELKKRYTKQMELYSAAVESISQIQVKKTTLYSFSLGKCVEV